MDFDPLTGLAPDGTIGPTQRQRELATESLKVQEQLATMEDELRMAEKQSDKDLVRSLNERLRAAHRKLAEIQRQQRDEQARKNRSLEG